MRQSHDGQRICSLTEEIQLILSPEVRGHIRELFAEDPHWGERRPDFSGLIADGFGGAIECSGGADDRQALRHKVFQALIIRFRPRPFIQTHDGLRLTLAALSPPTVQPCSVTLAGPQPRADMLAPWTLEPAGPGFSAGHHHAAPTLWPFDRSSDGSERGETGHDELLRKKPERNTLSATDSGRRSKRWHHHTP